MSLKNIQNNFYLLFFLFSTTTFCQLITIKGKVVNNNDEIIDHATILLLDNSKKTVAYTFTDKNGLFSLQFEKKKTITQLKLHL